MENMTLTPIQQTMALIQEAWSEEISSSPFESALGLESKIDGKEAFMARVLDILLRDKLLNK